MRTVRDDLGIVEHQDHGGIANGAEPMRDDEHGLPHHQLSQRSLNESLAIGIQGAGRFIQYQDGCLA